MALNEHRVHQAFRLSIVLKGLHALAEIAGGLAFYFIPAPTVLDWVNALTRMELTEDPRDFVATHLLAAAQSLTGSEERFYAFYLVSHGLIKLVLVVGLLREKLVFYPISLVAMGGFIAYQLYRYSYTGSFGLILLTIFDVVVMWFIWHEWRRMERHLPLE